MSEEIKIEQVSNDFCLIENTHSFYRVDFAKKRHYYNIVDDKVTIFPSWTTVIGKTMPLSDGLKIYYQKHTKEEADDILEERSAYGTALHILISEFLVKGELDINRSNIYDKLLISSKDNISDFREWIPSLQSDLLSFAQFCLDKELEVIASEVTLASNIHGIAGTIDIVAKISFKGNRILVLIDVKSGKKGFFDNHIVQVHGYKQTWDENFPKYPIDKVFNWSPEDWRSTPSYNFVDQTNRVERELIPGLVTNYFIKNHVTTNYTVYSGIIKPGVSLENNYRTIDIVSMIKEKFNIKPAPTKTDEIKNLINDSNKYLEF